MIQGIDYQKTEEVIDEICKQYTSFEEFEKDWKNCSGINYNIIVSFQLYYNMIDTEMVFNQVKNFFN